MNANDLLPLGLGLTPSWQVVGPVQDVVTSRQRAPLAVAGRLGERPPCPECGFPLLFATNGPAFRPGDAGQRRGLPRRRRGQADMAGGDARRHQGHGRFERSRLTASAWTQPRPGAAITR